MTLQSTDWKSSLKSPLLVKKFSPENSTEKNLLPLQTNSAHKHSQLGSRTTEPITAWRIYFRLPLLHEVVFRAFPESRGNVD